MKPFSQQQTGHYAQLGKTEYVFVSYSPEELPLSAALGLKNISPGVRWIVGRDVVPAWLNYVNDVFHMRAA